MPNCSFAAVVFCVLASAAVAAAQEGHPEHTWDYGELHGPSHWGDLEPQFAPCKTGHRQSPIDIRKPEPADLSPIMFHYKSSPLHIIDNGHTIMINYAPGSFISVGRRKYALKQFHFHRPSEEKINGEQYDMVVHLVHANPEGKLAVVAVLLQKGSDNALVRELWSRLPKEKEKEESFKNVQINAAEVLPDQRSYYTFPGSLTTPPCTEDVTWFVLKRAVDISASEVDQFSRIYPNNARPTQQLFKRIVWESK